MNKHKKSIDLLEKGRILTDSRKGYGLKYKLIKNKLMTLVNGEWIESKLPINSLIYLEEVSVQNELQKIANDFKTGMTVSIVDYNKLQLSQKYPVFCHTDTLQFSSIDPHWFKLIPAPKVLYLRDLPQTNLYPLGFFEALHSIYEQCDFDFRGEISDE